MRRAALAATVLWLVGAATAQATPCGAGRCHLFRAASGATGEIAAGPDGALWYAGNGFLGRMTVSGRVTRIDAPVTPDSDVAAGTDGAVWFTVADGRVGRVAPDGGVSLRSLGAGGGLGSLASGPDGAMWFALGSSAGRIGVDGRITRYSLPAPVYGRNSLVTGSDGALWMDASFTLLRLTTTGQTTSYGVMPAPVPFRFPFPVRPSSIGELAAGPDGGIWATLPDAGRVVRLSPRTGRTTIFRTSQRPLHITSGPSHALWFTMTAPRRRLSVVRMTPSGFQSFFQVDRSVRGLAVGANQGIFMTKGNGIERLTPFLGARVIRSRVLLVNTFAGSASVRLLCPKFDHVFCAGTITLRHRGQVVASAPFSQRVNDAPATRLLLTVIGRRLMRARARVLVRMTIVQHDQGGTGRRTTQNVYLRRR